MCVCVCVYIYQFFSELDQQRVLSNKYGQALIGCWFLFFSVM